MLHVAAAIIRRNGEILICQRRPGGGCGGLWEFPGGKLEPDETPERCVIRECREELGVEIRLNGLREQSSYRYPEKEIVFSFFEAELLSGDPCLRVHQAMAWRPPSQLADYEFCPADRRLVRELARQDSEESQSLQRSV
jgi:8-oxo-dGTP diphosphatase